MARGTKLLNWKTFLGDLRYVGTDQVGGLLGLRAGGRIQGGQQHLAVRRGHRGRLVPGRRQRSPGGP